jgi:hypothetical protein
MKKSTLSMMMSLLVGIGIAGCDPFQKGRKEQAEKTRVECLDKVCEGDTPPVAGTGEAVLKLNGQWYLAPQQYVKGLAGLAFYWPSKTPVAGRTDRQSFPEQRRDYYDVAIEVFLTSSRAGTPGRSIYQTLLQLESQGDVISKRNLAVGLASGLREKVTVPRIGTSRPS